MQRREFIKATTALALSASLPEIGRADSLSRPDPRLFPADLPNKQWLRFGAFGFTKPACGVIYRLGDQVTNGLALGGIDTGCLDLETSGKIGRASCRERV